MCSLSLFKVFCLYVYLSLLSLFASFYSLFIFLYLCSSESRYQSRSLRKSNYLIVSFCECLYFVSLFIFIGVCPSFILSLFMQRSLSLSLSLTNFCFFRSVSPPLFSSMSFPITLLFFVNS